MKTSRSFDALLVIVAVVLGTVLPAPADAQTVPPRQRLCDPEYQDCRADLVSYIAQETVEIDMGFWLMDDARYATALIAAWQRGVKIRLLMDPRCTTEHPDCAPVNAQLAQAGLPMRRRTTTGILHWKAAVFAGQGQVEFSGANYSPFEMVPTTPYQNYTDEIVMYSNDPSLVQSFMSKFDDLWTSTTEFANYANVTGPLIRSYPTSPEDPQLNFPNDQSYRSRAVAEYGAENLAIDVAMFRITDEQESDALIAAVNRGLPVRLFTDETEYRNPARLWDAYNVDKLYHAGVVVRVDAHLGINHEKLVILRGKGMAVFGSSNWTSPSSDTQREHNLFTTEPWILTWAENQFNRKWTNDAARTESKPFTPLPPDDPIYSLPPNGATGVAPSRANLSWNGGLWGQLYDIYVGTSPNPPLVAQNQKLGPSQFSTDDRTYALPPLQPGTTYYWKIVSKTMADLTATGPVWSFTTSVAATAVPSSTVQSTSTTCPGYPTPAFPGAVCANGGWVPGGSTSASSPPPSTPPPVSAASSSTTCPGYPNPAFPGAVCVNAGWVPAGSTSPPTPPPTPPPVSVASSSTTCPGYPNPAFPGAACVNGGWVPAGSTSPPNSPPPTRPPVSGGSSSTTCPGYPNPAFPGAVCVNGGWVPADPTATSSDGCSTPDPFTAIGGGVCLNGGWRPKG